jgi:hypothetical protein
MLFFDFIMSPDILIIENKLPFQSFATSATLNQVIAKPLYAFKANIKSLKPLMQSEKLIIASFFVYKFHIRKSLNFVKILMYLTETSLLHRAKLDGKYKNVV